MSIFVLICKFVVNNLIYIIQYFFSICDFFNKTYFIPLSDNPDVDVLGSNLYNNFLRRFRHVSGGDKSPTEGHSQYKKVSVAQSRTVPPDAAFLPQTAKGIDCKLSFDKGMMIYFKNQVGLTH